MKGLEALNKLWNGEQNFTMKGLRERQKLYGIVGKELIVVDILRKHKDIILHELEFDKDYNKVKEVLEND